MEKGSKALKNLSESLVVFLALAILSIVLSVDENTMLPYWLIARLVFVVIYVLGLVLIISLGVTGPDRQPFRSLYGLACLILVNMTLNLL